MQNTEQALDKIEYRERTKERLKRIYAKGIRVEFIANATGLRKGTVYTITGNTYTDRKSLSIETLNKINNVID